MTQAEVIFWVGNIIILVSLVGIMIALSDD